MSIVVTGAAGFIGRHVVDDLRADGVEVIGIDRRTQAESLVGLDRRTARFITADLLGSDPRVRAALSTATGVVHLAGRPGVRDDFPGIERLRLHDNVLATEAVLRSVGLDVPVVVASSSSVYGGSPGRPSLETDALLPRGGYARSKVGTEEVCERHRARGGRVTVVRPFTVLGAGQRADMAVSRWAHAAAAGRPIPIFGSELRTRDLTDVRGVSRALIDLLQIGHVGVLNLGSGHPRTLRELADSVSRAVTGSTAPAYVELTSAHAHDPADTFADTTQLYQVLGRGLHIDLDEVVAAAVRAALRGTAVVDLAS